MLYLWFFFLLLLGEFSFFSRNVPQLRTWHFDQPLSWSKWIQSMLNPSKERERLLQCFRLVSRKAQWFEKLRWPPSRVSMSAMYFKSSTKWFQCPHYSLDHWLLYRKPRPYNPFTATKSSSCCWLLQWRTHSCNGPSKRRRNEGIKLWNHLANTARKRG